MGREIGIKAAAFAGIGFALLVGIRAAEWLIPSPDTRIVVCFASDIGKVETCSYLSELRAAKH